MIKKKSKFTVIKIKNIKIPLYIGIYEWEKTHKQIIKISVTNYLKLPVECEIQDTLDYQKLCTDIFSFSNTKYDLIENLATKLISYILENHKNIIGIKLVIQKQVTISGLPTKVTVCKEKWLD